MATTIPKRRLGRNGPEISALGFGCMGLGEIYGQDGKEEYDDLLQHALDVGMTYWDTADIYGSSEQKIGAFFQRHPHRRNDVFLATKFGAYNVHSTPDQGPCSTPEYIRQQLKSSLDRLQTTYIDLYYQHRVDPNVPIEVVLDTLEPFVRNGTIKWIGLSEASLDTVRRARMHALVGEKVVAVQMEFSPFTLDVERNGFAEGCEELGVSVVAYSPLARGMISGRYRSRADFDEGDLRLRLPRWSEENFDKNLALVDKIIQLAKASDATSAQVTLAWILAEHPTFIPIPGCRTIDRLDENAKGALLRLSVQEQNELRRLAEQAEVAGSRNVTLPWVLEGVKGDCIPLAQWAGDRV